MARWLEVLSQYEFDIVHRAGTQHKNADALSRMWEREAECPSYTSGTTPEQLPCGGCKKCTKMYQEWSKFEEDVDNVVPLAEIAGNTGKASLSQNFIRVVTRSASKKERQENEMEIMVEQEKNTHSNINWTIPYTNKQIQESQRKDPLLCFIHIWFDNMERPPREAVSGQDPALRFYWLNWENLKRVDGILVQVWKSVGSKDIEHTQILLPKSLREEVLRHCHEKIFAAHL